MNKPRKKLYRNKQNNVIGGVCAGLADYFNLDAVLIRIACIIAVLFSLTVIIPVYLVAWFIIPENKNVHYSVKTDDMKKKTDIQVKHKTPPHQVKKRIKAFDKRLRDIETLITSEEWRLRQKFKDIE